MTEVWVYKDYYAWKIYLNGILHLYLPQDNGQPVAIQSWMDPALKRYYIEYTTGARVITSEYECRDTWLSIIAAIDKHIP